MGEYTRKDLTPGPFRSSAWEGVTHRDAVVVAKRPDLAKTPLPFLAGRGRGLGFRLVVPRENIVK